MDPFSALSLASNICQLLEFGGRLVSGSLELYRSRNGTSSFHGELEFIADDLRKMCGALTQPESRLDRFRRGLRKSAYKSPRQHERPPWSVQR